MGVSSSVTESLSPNPTGFVTDFGADAFRSTHFGPTHFGPVHETPRHDFAGPLKERGENLERSLLEFDFVAVASYFTHRRSTSNSPTRRRADAVAGSCMAGHQLFDFDPIPVPHRCQPGSGSFCTKLLKLKPSQKVLKPWISAKVVVEGIDLQ
jgi:hypothetical protein